MMQDRPTKCNERLAEKECRWVTLEASNYFLGVVAHTDPSAPFESYGKHEKLQPKETL